MQDTAPKRRAARPALFALLAAGLVALGGCTAFDTRPDAAPASAQSASSSLRDQLNDGYSKLYATADGLSQVDRIFYVKIESDPVQRVVENVTGYSGELATRLEQLRGDFPALAIDHDNTPPIIEAAEQAQKQATLKRFAPVVGTAGVAFERGLLIRLLGAVDQQHYLAETLAEREPDTALSQIMASAAERYAGFYEQIDALLIERFYR